ncbi:MAG: DUF1566 domain-containing protein [Nitrospira sp.]|nr:DUF1566 domain-containing protein [Nitrospira sp.]
MRDRWRSQWGWRICAVLLLMGGLVLGTGTVVTQAWERDDDHQGKNPFDRILHKLDKILDAIKSGGGQDGNHTLRWDTNHPSASRFVVLKAFNNQAVLDKNTGLVWEQAPGGSAPWAHGAHTPEVDLAPDICLNKNIGGTVGWRLPSVVELKSVQDPNLPAPFVPASIFTGISAETFWSATTAAEIPDAARAVNFGTGGVGGSPTYTTLRVWCVRGGMNADAY